MKRLVVFISVIFAFFSVNAKGASNLRNLFDELDLIIRNHHSDLIDIRRQEREFEILRVFDRIPFDDRLSELHHELALSAERSGVKLIRFKPIPRSKKDLSVSPIPKTLYTDDSPFRFSPEQLTERLEFVIKIRKTDESSITQWLTLITEDNAGLLRLVKTDRVITKLSNDVVSVRLWAFRFRKVRFPHLRPRKPEGLGPMARQIRDMIPKARPCYRTKEQYLLNAARMSLLVEQTQRNMNEYSKPISFAEHRMQRKIK